MRRLKVDDVPMKEILREGVKLNARLRDEDCIRRHGKPYAELSPVDKMIIDDLIKEMEE
jgi:hypothetical protein